MSESNRSPGLPSLLFWLTLGVSAALVLMVLTAPLMANDEGPTRGLARGVALFAHDATLRRTALASAIGLIVTAFVFFRVPAPAKVAVRKTPQLPTPPRPIIGA